MPFQMPISHRVGNDYPKAYWTVDTLRVTRSEPEVVAVYRAWKDRAAFDAGKAPIPGVERVYAIWGAEATNAILAYHANPTDVIGLVDRHALETLDAPDPEHPDDHDRLVSFFAAAKRV